MDRKTRKVVLALGDAWYKEFLQDFWVLTDQFRPINTDEKEKIRFGGKQENLEGNDGKSLRYVLSRRRFSVRVLGLWNTD